VYFFKLIFILSVTGVLLILWYSIVIKLDITFTGKTNPFNYNYILSGTNIMRTDCIKHLGMLLDSNLWFHHHVYYIFSKSLKTLVLIRTLTYSFSATDSLLLLHVTLVRPVLEYASPAWNSITATDTNKLERTQRVCISKFQAFLFFTLVD
jgi:hypothetical protein